MKKTFLTMLAIFGISTLVLAADGIAVFHEQYIAYKNIPATVTYTGSTTIGDDLEIKLGEDRDAGKLWQVVSYDPAVCRLKIDHDRDGVWPVIIDKAEIEIKPLVRGTATVVLQCGEKKATIVVTAL